MNIVIIKGNLTRDPELRYLPNGTAVAQCGVAVNEVWNDKDGNRQEKVHFFDVTFWGRTAESVTQYFKKGKPILLNGRLRMDTWDDKQTGQKRSKVAITADRWEFAGGDMGGNGQRAATGEAPQPDANYDGGQPGAPEADDVPF